MSKIYVAMITKNLELNGITRVIMNYCQNLSKSRFDITVIASRPFNQSVLEYLKGNDIKIIEVSNQSFNYLKELNNIFQNHKFDIVHIHGNSAIISFECLIAKKNNIKKIITHSHNTTCSHKILHYLLQGILNKIVDIRIACSNDAGKWLYKNKKYYVLNNGINLEKFRFNKQKRDELKEKFNLKSNIVIGHIGRFNNQKNQIFLINCFNELYKLNKNITLVLVGTGPNFLDIKNYIKNLDCSNNIILTGEVKNPQNYYNLFDLFVLPSLYEGMPVVLIEAQANGLKCLTSKNVTPDVNITNTIKFLELDLQKWIDEINHTIKDEDRSSTSQNNISILKEQGFDILNNIKMLENLYEGEENE